MAFEFIIAALLAALASAAFAPLVMAAGVMDAPDRVRKVQRAPTPTSGGLAIGLGFAASAAAILLWPNAQWSAALSVGALWTTAWAIAACMIALVLGLADDVLPLPAMPKFAAVACIGVIFSVWGARAEAFPLGAGMALHLGMVIGVLGSALWLFTIVNTTNFMDGANGLSMGSTAIGLSTLGIVAMMGAAPHAAALAFCGAGAIVGFLVWNFPKGSVFAGDSGSLFAGMLAAVVGLILAQDAGVSPVVCAIAFFPLLADVLLTLNFRVGKRRPNLFDGHNEHLFQIGLRAGLSHRRVSLTYWALTAHCGLIAIITAHAQRILPPDLFLPQAGDLSMQEMLLLDLYRVAAWIAAFSPYIALAVLAWVSVKISGKVRAFAASSGLDAA